MDASESYMLSPASVQDAATAASLSAERSFAASGSCTMTPSKYGIITWEMSKRTNSRLRLVEPATRRRREFARDAVGRIFFRVWAEAHVIKK